MTDYNSGDWFGWNGGECPVHPETLVECVCVEGGIHTSREKDDAGEWDWSDDDCPIIAFRVVKEYREPREFWVWVDTSGSVHISKMQIPCSFKVREVIE